MSADRNLLFGILAVQLDFVTRDALIAGMNAWLLAKGKPLGDILRDHGHLPASRLQLLDALVEEHLRQHGNDPHRSLAALSGVDSALKRSLAAVADTDVQQTLKQVGVAAGGAEPADPYATRIGPSPAVPRLRYRVLRPHARGG